MGVTSALPIIDPPDSVGKVATTVLVLGAAGGGGGGVFFLKKLNIRGFLDYLHSMKHLPLIALRRWEYSQSG
jgi:hypothetical protein